MDIRQKCNIIWSCEGKLNPVPYTNEGGNTVIFKELHSESNGSMYVDYRIGCKKYTTLVTINGGSKWINAIYNSIPKEAIALLKTECPYLFSKRDKEEDKERQTQLYQELKEMIDEDNYDTLVDAANIIQSENEIAPLSNDLKNMLNNIKLTIKKLTLLN